MNTVSESKRADIIRALCEGNSILATALLTRTAKATVLKSLMRVGESCAIYQGAVFFDLPTKQVLVNEIWSFVGAKAKKAMSEGAREVWTHIAMDADSKLMISWRVGPRNDENRRSLMTDVANRLGNRAQLSTDGLASEVAQIIKDYGLSKHEHGTRRLTPLTNGFSRKTENHTRAVSLFFMYYNFCQAHRTLTEVHKGVATTPAMAAGITDHVWTVEEIIAETKNPSQPPPPQSPEHLRNRKQ